MSWEQKEIGSTQHFRVYNANPKDGKFFMQTPSMSLYMIIEEAIDLRNILSTMLKDGGFE